VKTFSIIILVAAGGALGALSRFAVATVSRRFFGVQFPWGTLLINVSGCFALGLLAGLFNSKTSPTGLHYGLGIGFLGAFTTFSTYELEGMLLLNEGRHGLACLYLGGSVVLGLAAMYGGYLLGRANPASF